MCKTFLHALFGEALSDNRQLALFTLPDRSARHFISLDMAAQQASQAAVSRDVYFGVGLAGTNFNQRNSAADVSALVALWADIDIAAPFRGDKALPQTLEDVRNLLAKMPYPPSILVDSGYGIHAYWLLKEAWDLDTAEQHALATRVAKGWHGLLCAHAESFGWELENLGDLARILRVPGTFNRKNGEAVEVRIIEEHPNCRYNPSDFEPFADVEHDVVATTDDLMLRADAEPPADKFAALMATLPAFVQAWEKNRPELKDQSQSAYDFSLANIAALNGWSDQEIASLVIAARRKHNAKPEKALRADYITRTLAQAKSYAEERNGTASDTTVNLDGILNVERPFQFAGELLSTYTHLRKPVIHGLLREGETMNIIAPPKTGKTWLTMGIAFGVATGQPVLGFPTSQGRVLILDNELHPETVSHRLPAVAEAMGIPLAQYEDKIAYKLLRGRLKDLHSLESILSAIPAGYFKIIILDAFYRFLPKDTDENDNGSMAALYNKIDAIAERQRCAIIAIHHTSKGSQSIRAVTDVGAGAGSISRAADCHLILRPHKEQGAVVLDATPRSWPPVASSCLRFEYPCWLAAPELDPTQLLMPGTKKKAVAEPETAVVVEKWTRKRFVAEFFTASDKTKAALLAAVEDRDDRELSHYRAERFMETAEAAGDIFRWDNGPSKAPSFATIPQPTLHVGGGGEGECGFALEVNSKATHTRPSLPPKRRKKTKPKPNGDKVPA